MASFSDQILQFNPYVSRLPLIQEMNQVGMEKQAKYDLGVQTIQNEADQAAAIDVLRPYDKQVLQSKLNELGSKLKTVAAGDFSNSQLVHSVGGMAKSIMKDPQIQTAVYSTQKIRQGIQDKQTANKTGKGSVDNDWYFDSGVNNYLSSTDPNSTYSGGYIEYKDLKPKMIETLKSLHESGTDKEVPWATYKDKDGKQQIDYGTTAKAMVESGWKGITSGKIKDALAASLDENDLRQLQISGMYQFRNYTPDDLAKHAQGQYDASIKAVTDKIQALQKYAAANAGNKNLYKQSLDSINELQEQIGEKGDYRGVLKNQLNSQLAAIRTNPDGVKGELYKNATINQFADSHAWEESVTKYLSNPILDADHWTSTFKLQNAAQIETHRHNLATEGHNDKIYDLEFWKAHGGKGGSFTTFGGKEQETKAPSEIVNSQMGMYTANANSGLASLAQHIQDNARKIPGNDKVVVTPEDADKMIKGTYNGPIKNPISPDLKSTVDDILENRRQSGLHASVINNAHDAALQNENVKKAYQAINTELSQLKPVTVVKDGKSYIFSQKEILDYVSKNQKLPTAGLSTNTYSGSTAPFMTYGGKPLTDREKILDGYSGVLALAKQYSKVIQKTGDANNVYNKEYENQIAERVPEYAPKYTAVETPSATARSKWETMANALSLRDSQDKGGYDDWDSSKVKSWLADPKTKDALQYTTFDNGVVKQLLVTGPDGSTQRRTLSQVDISQVPEVQTSSATQTRYDLMMGGGTTNSEKNGGYEGAKWKEESFPLIKNTRIVADAISDKRNKNVVFPVIQVKTSEGWIPMQIEKPMTVENLQQFYGGLDDAQIRSIFKHYHPNFKGKLE